MMGKPRRSLSNCSRKRRAAAATVYVEPENYN